MIVNQLIILHQNSFLPLQLLDLRPVRRRLDVPPDLRLHEVPFVLEGAAHSPGQVRSLQIYLIWYKLFAQFIRDLCHVDTVHFLVVLNVKICRDSLVDLWFGSNLLKFHGMCRQLTPAYDLSFRISLIWLLIILRGTALFFLSFRAFIHYPSISFPQSPSFLRIINLLLLNLIRATLASNLIPTLTLFRHSISGSALPKPTDIIGAAPQRLPYGLLGHVPEAPLKAHQALWVFVIGSGGFTRGVVAAWE